MKNKYVVEFTFLRGSAGKYLLLVVALLLAGTTFAQMVNPAIDVPNQPFSYYAKPTDVIGVKDGQTGTLISPEGFFYTGYGELMFFSGNPQVAIAQRIKTLLDGYLPVVQYTFVRDGIRYSFTAFAATLEGASSDALVDFIRVQVKNENSAARTAWVSSGMRYEGNINTTTGHADNRYRRPYMASHLGGYNQMGIAFDPNWKYSSAQDNIQRNDNVIYYFPSQAHTVRYTLKDNPSAQGTLPPKVLKVLPTSPVGVVQYKLSLRPGQQATLDWKLPVVPVAAGSSEVTKLESATFDEYLPRVVNFWNDILKTGLTIHVPEAKVNDAFKANLIYDLIAREKVDGNYIQTVNDFHYHAFWLRDASFIDRMYDISGYPEYSHQVLDFFAHWQEPDGNFVSQGGQFDGVGQTLWAYGQHYEITHDRQFAEEVYPSVVRAVAWIKQARQGDPLHLMPSTRPGDNEDITGHVTGHNLWALDGLRDAVVLANATGRTADATEFQREYDDYYSTFLKVLDRITQKTGGYIPPGLDGQHGQDWGNMLAVYPGIVLPLSNPMVTATLNATRARYKEGIMTYGDGEWLHDYLGFSNTETELLLGDQQLAVRDLYAELVHTSSTHAGFETDIRAWGDRDFGDNLSPHGWYAARLRIDLRNMMVREQGSNLHLFSAISPDWIRPGSEIDVDRAPTNFGTVDMSLKSISATRAELTFHASFVDPPTNIILHLPWFMETRQVLADGKSLPIVNGGVVLPLTVRTVHMDWSKKADSESLSYDRAVSQYKTEYATRYQQFLRTGERNSRQ
jgi:hypothetical protein